MSPSWYMAKIVAIRSATNGSPKKLNTGITPDIDGMTPNTDLRMMSANGIRMMPAIVPKGGSLASSKSA